MRVGIALMLVLGLAACEQTEENDAGPAASEDAGAGETDAGPGETDAGPAAPGQVEPLPAEVSFVHGAGVTPCPQMVGNITLASSLDEASTFTVAPTSQMLDVTPRTGSIEPGGTMQVTIAFTCMVPTIPLDLDEVVTISHSGTEQDSSIRVRGDID